MKFLQITDKNVLKEIKKSSPDIEIVEITSAKQFYEMIHGTCEKKYLVTVKCTSYKIHVAAFLKSQVIGYLKHGDSVLCVKLSDSWYKMVEGKGFIYNNSKYLSEKEL